jgi:hypothetical protein
LLYPLLKLCREISNYSNNLSGTLTSMAVV